MSASVALTLVALSAAPLKLVAPEWKTVNVPADLASFYADEFARALRAEGFEVVTSGDIVTMVGVERQKQLLGCSADGSSCLAELGAALGCEHVLTGQLARLDDAYQGSVRIFSATSGKTLASVPVSATGQRALVVALDEAAKALALQLRPAAPPPPPRAYAWIPLVAGVALGAGAGVAFAVSADDYARIPDGDEATALTLAERGTALQTAGWVMGGVGAAALVTSAVLLLAGGAPAAVTPQVSVTSSGAAVGVVGVFP